MTKEELIKNQFPNDEFLQSAVLQIVDKCIAELEKENAELKKGKGLMKELLIALKIYGAKYNVSLIADTEKFISEVENWQ